MRLCAHKPKPRVRDPCLCLYLLVSRQEPALPTRHFVPIALELSVKEIAVLATGSMLQMLALVQVPSRAGRRQWLAVASATLLSNAQKLV